MVFGSGFARMAVLGADLTGRCAGCIRQHFLDDAQLFVKLFDESQQRVCPVTTTHKDKRYLPSWQLNPNITVSISEPPKL